VKRLLKMCVCVLFVAEEQKQLKFKAITLHLVPEIKATESTCEGWDVAQ
jgi:hypothetical protein